MKSARGFSLVELLVVITIISVLSGVGFVSYKDFAYNQDAVKASQEIQSILRLAQTNATTSTRCNSVGSAEWSLNMLNSTTLELRCNPSNFLHRSYTLESAQIESITPACTLPVTLSFSNRFGVVKILSSNPADACLLSNIWTIKVKSSNKATKFKTFNITKGGAIDAQ